MFVFTIKNNLYVLVGTNKDFWKPVKILLTLLNTDAQSVHIKTEPILNLYTNNISDKNICFHEKFNILKYPSSHEIIYSHLLVITNT